MLVARERNLHYLRRVPAYEQKERTAFVPQKLWQARVKIVTLVIFVFLVSVLLIAQYCCFIALNLKIDHVQSDIARLQEEKSSLEMEVKKLSSLERLEMIALEELGLQYPEERQWLVLTSR